MSKLNVALWFAALPGLMDTMESIVSKHFIQLKLEIGEKYRSEGWRSPDMVKVVTEDNWNDFKNICRSNRVALPVRATLKTLRASVKQNGGRIPDDFFQLDNTNIMRDFEKVYKTLVEHSKELKERFNLKPQAGSVEMDFKINDIEPGRQISILQIIQSSALAGPDPNFDIQFVAYFGHGAYNAGAWVFPGSNSILSSNGCPKRMDVHSLIDSWADSINGMKNKHLIIISDSCFSGGLVQELLKLKSSDLNLEDKLSSSSSSITIQSSCASNEIAVGGFFLPAWAFLNSLSDETYDHLNGIAREIVDCDDPNIIIANPDFVFLGSPPETNYFRFINNESLPLLYLAALKTCSRNDDGSVLWIGARGKTDTSVEAKLTRILKTQWDAKCDIQDFKSSLNEQGGGHPIQLFLRISVKGVEKQPDLNGEYCLHIHLKGVPDQGAFDWTPHTLSTDDGKAVHMTRMVSAADFVVDPKKFAHKNHESDADFEGESLPETEQIVACYMNNFQEEQLEYPFWDSTLRAFFKRFCMLNYTVRGDIPARLLKMAEANVEEFSQKLREFNAEYATDIQVLYEPYLEDFAFSAQNSQSKASKFTLQINDNEMKVIIGKAKTWLKDHSQPNTAIPYVALKDTTLTHTFSNWYQLVIVDGCRGHDGAKTDLFNMMASLNQSFRSRNVDPFANTM